MPAFQTRKNASFTKCAHPNHIGKLVSIQMWTDLGKTTRLLGLHLTYVLHTQSTHLQKWPLQGSKPLEHQTKIRLAILFQF